MSRFIVLGVLLSCIFMGCEQSTAPQSEVSEAAGKKLPTTFEEGVIALDELNETIGVAHKNGNPDEAHGPLHDVSHTIATLSSLAAKAKLPSEDLVELKTATDTLLDAFGELDKTLHGHDGQSYEEVAGNINASMKTIRSLAGFKDFSQVVTDVISIRNTIRDSIAAGDLEGAHEPLHEVGYSLEKLGKLASHEDFSSQQLEEIKAATDQLFEDFGEVDKTFHGAEGKPYEDVAESIDSAINAIANLAGVDPDSVESTVPGVEEDAGSVDEVEVQDAGDEVEIQDADDS